MSMPQLTLVEPSAQAPPRRHDTLLAAADAAMRRRGLALETRRIYLTWMRRLLTSSRREGGDPPSPRELGAGLTRLVLRRRLRASSLKQARAAVRFLLREVLGAPTHAEEVHAVAGARPAPPFTPTLCEVLELLAACPHPRDRLLIGLLYGSGLRLSEALHVCAADLDPAGGLLTVRPTWRRSGRRVPLSPLVAELAAHHLRDCLPWERLIRAKGAQALTSRGAQRALARAALRAGFSGGMTAAALRRGFAAALLDQGVPAETVLALMGARSLGCLSEVWRREGLPGEIGSPL